MRIIQDGRPQRKLQTTSMCPSCFKVLNLGTLISSWFLDWLFFFVFSFIIFSHTNGKMQKNRHIFTKEASGQRPHRAQLADDLADECLFTTHRV